MEDRQAASSNSGDVRRTNLAGERTMLAWWRTGMTAIAVALAVGRILPELAPDAHRWPFALLGVAFAVYGIALFAFGSRSRPSARSEFGSEGTTNDRLIAALAIGGLLLGVCTLVVVLLP